MRSARIHPGLLLLALRRSAPLSFVVVLLALLALATTRDVAAPAFLPAFGAEVASTGRARALVWAVLLLFAAPVLVARAATIAQVWRARDADWFAPLPVSRLTFATHAALGLWLVALFMAVLTAALAEGAARQSGAEAPSLRWAGALEHPAGLLLEGDPGWGWSPPTLRAEDLPTGARMVLAPTVAPGSGPALTVRATLASDGDGTTEIEQRIFGRTRLELPLPPDARGALRLRLRRDGPGAVLVLPPESIDLFVPVTSPSAARDALFARVLLLLLPWIALAAGLGAWMRPGLAFGASLALASLPWVAPGLPLLGSLPGADFPRAWGLVDAGHVPGVLGAGALGAGTLLALVGVLLLARGLGHGRSLS